MANTATSPVTVAPAAPTDAALHALCAREHHACFACRPAVQGGLGLVFAVRPGGSVSAEWTCPPGGESFEGIVHGGLLTTALDSAMIHALFARGIVARTGELSVRYRSPVRIAEPVTIVAKYCGGMPPLHRLEAEIRQAGHLCAKAAGKFMAVSE
jgi:acyl-coenzyme A thioesterase PaaI-like protein